VDVLFVAQCRHWVKLRRTRGRNNALRAMAADDADKRPLGQHFSFVSPVIIAFIGG
jgi:hypothetical protein